MSMQIIPLLQKELQQEAEITRKMLSRVPNDKYDWKPHEKNMTLRQLATHIGELPGWICMVLNTTELDFAASPYVQEQVDNTTDLLAYFERTLVGGVACLENADPAQLEDMWTLRSGKDIYSHTTKYEFLRVTFAQMIHHRAQLGMYLRLLNIPIPGSYGPSADEMGF
jgi:uncharacterized damage-inducible protein DinB